MFQASRIGGAALRNMKGQGQALSSVNHQIRCIGWTEFVEARWDAQAQKWLSEDPMDSVHRIQEEVDSKGRSMTYAAKMQSNFRYTKPTTVKKERRARIKYERKRNQVMDLVHYIKFVQTHKNADNW